MSVRSEAVTEQIRSAMQSSNPHDIIAGVKSAVAQEVGSLSPEAKIVFTDYFNHSYMPDLVMEWNESGKRVHRPIFLRSTLRPAALEQEVQDLAGREPVVLSLTPSDPAARLDALRERAQAADRVLVTDVASLAEVASPSGKDGSPAAVQSGASGPLLRLVQANLLKGGRGVMTTEDAGRLTRSVAGAHDADGITREFLSTFEKSSNTLFAPDAALRLQRAAELLRFGLSPASGETLSFSQGQLSDVELRVLLPYLLSDDSARANTRLWQYLGSMMSLERLEDMWDVLPDVDVSSLVVPNLAVWTGRRAQLVINSASEEDVARADPDVGDNEPVDPGAAGVGGDVDVETPPIGFSSWYVRSRMLTTNAGYWKVFVTTDARRLKGRNDSATARWDDISSLLRGFALDAVDLRGISRRIFVGAAQSSDISADVGLIRENIDDDFHVTEVRVRRLGDDESAGLHVDFTEMTVTAEGRAPVASLVSAAGLLGHRQPLDLQAILGEGAAVQVDGSAE